MPTRVDSRLQRSLHMANLLIGESVERAMSTATRRDFETDLLDAAGRVFAPIPPPRIAEVQHDYDRTRLALVAYADEAEARAAVAELQPARLRDQLICRVNSFGRRLRSRTGRTMWRPASSSG